MNTLPETDDVTCLVLGYVNVVLSLEDSASSVLDRDAWLDRIHASFCSRLRGVVETSMSDSEIICGVNAELLAPLARLFSVDARVVNNEALFEMKVREMASRFVDMVCRSA